MPLVSGDQFHLTLHVNASYLTAVLHGTGYTVTYEWLNKIDLLSTVYLGIARKVSLQYVNLISSTDCLPA